jgi:hypothetical protein
MVKQSMIFNGGAAYLSKIGGGTIANIGELNLLAKHSIAIVRNDIDANVLIADIGNASATAFGGSQKPLGVTVYIGTGDSAIGALATKKIELSFLNSVFKTYAAPVAEKLFIGDNGEETTDLNLPLSFLPGDTLEVSITDSSGFLRGNVREHYQYSVKASDTKALVVAGIVAAINKGSLMTATAIAPSTVNAGIQLVGNIVGIRYNVTVGTLLTDAPIQTAHNAMGIALTSPAAVSASVGRGTATQVKEEIMYDSAVFGNTARISYTEDFFNSQVTEVPAGNYDILTLNYLATGSYGTHTRESVPQVLTLFSVAGALTTAVKNFFTTQIFGETV